MLLWLGWTVDGLPTLADVQALVAAAGPGGPLVYIVLYAAGTVALVPGAALTVLAGLLFGPLLGTIVAVAGASVGASGAFWVARRFGRGPTERLLNERLADADRWIAERGFLAVLSLRLVPLVPFNVLNYAAGFTGVSTRAYVGATVIGIVPGAFAYAALGGTAADPLSAPFLGAVALIAVLMAAGVAVRRRWVADRSADTAEPGGARKREQGRDEEQERER